MREHKAVRIELIQGKGGIAAQAAHATLFLLLLWFNFRIARDSRATR